MIRDQSSLVSFSPNHTEHTCPWGRGMGGDWEGVAGRSLTLVFLGGGHSGWSRMVRTRRGMGGDEERREKSRYMVLAPLDIYIWGMAHRVILSRFLCGGMGLYTLYPTQGSATWLHGPGNHLICDLTLLCVSAFRTSERRFCLLAVQRWIRVEQSLCQHNTTTGRHERRYRGSLEEPGRGGQSAPCLDHRRSVSHRVSGLSTRTRAE